MTRAALSLDDGRCLLKACERPDEYEVWRATEVPIGPAHKALRDVMVGRVIVQDLPVWLPKVRVDARNQHSTAGWFDEHFCLGAGLCATVRGPHRRVLCCELSRWASRPSLRQR